ncbi:MAG TPA: kynureninase [Acidobacteriota bacterium]|nr:kynureninase [Acidobacteriota bacterium]
MFLPTEAFALQLDQADPLARFRNQFHQPEPSVTGEPLIYFCGNSLGLQPKGVRESVLQEIDDWAQLAVHGHFKEHNPWVSYEQALLGPMAELVGAQPEEVAIMNGLTVNLHLLMVSFFRPTATRHQILLEANAFPSDQYALQSQIRFHGFDPESAFLEAHPRPGEDTLHTEDIVALIEEHGHKIALVMFAGVNYLTGQVFDIAAITEAAHKQGCVVGIDLAHAVGNVPLRLHDWDVDFAVWCSYKYLNSGPGAVAGCFVHERHRNAPELPRFTGWWGTKPQIRFEMRPTFDLQPGAAGWQLSNLPILSMAALKASLDIFHEAGILALREKSEKLTSYLLSLLDQNQSGKIAVITPRNLKDRGCQISIRVFDGARTVFQRLEEAGVIGDFREPNVIRVAPVPLYNTFHEVWRFAQIWQALI